MGLSKSALSTSFDTIATMFRLGVIMLIVASASALSCTTFKEGVFADMHDGDQKKLTLDGSKLTIVPHGNNQTWVVETTVDDKCTAVVDFNVPGKPGPPPVNLTASIYALLSKGEGIAKHAVEFTDPSGTLKKDPHY